MSLTTFSAASTVIFRRIARRCGGVSCGRFASGVEFGENGSANQPVTRFSTTFSGESASGETQRSRSENFSQIFFREDAGR
jgi:hypothetical protein